MTYSHYNPFAYMLALESWAETAPEQHRPQIYQVGSFIETAQQAEHVWKFVVEGSQRLNRPFNATPMDRRELQR